MNYLSSFNINYLSIGVNFIIFVIQLIISLFTNSISLLSDAFDSLRDIFITLVVVWSLYLSKKPPDKMHPFGHGRIEEISGFGISIFLLAIGLNFLLESFTRLFVPKEIKITFSIVLIVILFSIIKLILGFFTQIVYKRSSMQILEAESLHHYLDALTTFVVGVGLLLVKKGYIYIDALLGLFISIVIIFGTIKLIKKFLNSLIGKRVSPQIYEKIKDIVFSFKSIEGLHDIEVHSYGQNRFISFHIEVSPSLSLEEAHSICGSLEKKIFNENLGKCIVHVDLKKGKGLKKKQKIENLIRKIIKKIKNIKDFHSLEIISLEDTEVLNFHITMPKTTSLDETHSISHYISKILEEEFGFLKVNIHFEPCEEVIKNEDRA